MLGMLSTIAALSFKKLSILLAEVHKITGYGF